MHLLAEMYFIKLVWMWDRREVWRGVGRAGGTRGEMGGGEVGEGGGGMAGQGGRRRRESKRALSLDRSTGKLHFVLVSIASSGTYPNQRSFYHVVCFDRKQKADCVVPVLGARGM